MLYLRSLVVKQVEACSGDEGYKLEPNQLAQSRSLLLYVFHSTEMLFKIAFNESSSLPVCAVSELYQVV